LEEDNDDKEEEGYDDDNVEEEVIVVCEYQVTFLVDICRLCVREIDIYFYIGSKGRKTP
jgi:hypothetical protein